MPRDPKKVALLAYDGLCAFEFGAMVELFGGLPRPEFDDWYTLFVSALEPGPLRSYGGISVEAPYTLRMLDRAGTIIVPGWRDLDEPAPEALVRKLRRAHDQGARLVSVCSGAFVLADTGLLDGKRATTHWRYAERFSARFPRVALDPDVLYVDEGQILTSAGSASGVDMGLHLIRRDFGTDAANAVARRLVVPPHREGGQQQFIQQPVERDPEGEALARLLDELRSKLKREHSVESMARMARMSPRTFARRFRESTGTTPHRWLQQERVRAAQSLLERTSLPLDSVAQRVGFSDAQLLRLHFKRVVGTTPLAYQRSFH
ncbi:MAG: transcriptional regulator FtrA [Planctomycetota bacterium]